MHNPSGLPKDSAKQLVCNQFNAVSDMLMREGERNPRGALPLAQA